MNLCDPTSIVYHVGSASSGSRHNQFKVELTAANNLYLIYKNMEDEGAGEIQPILVNRDIRTPIMNTEEI